MVMKKLVRIYQSSRTHLVGDGFPFRSVFDYNGLGKELSPFLLLDYPVQRNIFYEPIRVLKNAPAAETIENSVRSKMLEDNLATE